MEAVKAITADPNGEYAFLRDRRVRPPRNRGSHVRDCGQFIARYRNAIATSVPFLLVAFQRGGLRNLHNAHYAPCGRALR